MMNISYVVGRLVEKPELKEIESGKKVVNITLAVPRKFKNTNGEYDSDYINCTLWNNTAEEFVNCVKKDDVVSVKGTIKSRAEKINDINVNKLEVTAEKVCVFGENSNNNNLGTSAVMVGRITKDPELYTTDNGHKVANIIVAVPRSYKNSEGVYETDFINCSLWDGIAVNSCEYLKKGDLIGINGTLRVRKNEIGETKINMLEVVPSKVSFLAPKHSKDETDEIEEDITEEETIIESKKETKTTKKPRKSTTKKEPEIEVV